MRIAHNILAKKSEGKKPSGRPRRTSEYNTKIVVREIGCENPNWFHMSEDSNQYLVAVRWTINL
jgi:hypothetical protein